MTGRVLFAALVLVVTGACATATDPDQPGPDSGVDPGWDTVWDVPGDTAWDTTADTGFDTGVDTGLDTGVDTGFDTGVDTGFDTGFDTGMDTGFDTGFDTGMDTGFDTGVDTGWDTGFDTGVDTGFDTGVDTGWDTGFDTGTDTATDPGTEEAVAGPGTSCTDAIDMSGGGTWSGNFSSFTNSWSGGTGCGYAYGSEVWFTATVPDGYTIAIEETSYSDVVIQAMNACPTTTCADYTDSPERLSWVNTTGSDVTMWVAVESYSGSTGSVDVTVTIAPPPEGMTCTDAIDVTAGGTWSGAFSDYADLWDGGTGCGYGAGAEVWFTATVQAGDLFRLEETTSGDMVLQQVSSCTVTSCEWSSDSPELFEYFNDTGSAQTVIVIVEKYYSGTSGSWSVDVTNETPDPGHSCDNPIDVTAGGTWSGSYSDAADLWSGGTGCGYASGAEVWFTVDVPDGNLLVFEETSSTDVVLEQVSGCSTTSCDWYSDTPEERRWYNDTGSTATICIIVEKYYSGTSGSWSVDVSNDPAPEGYTCTGAVDATSITAWSGSFTDYADLWDPASGCGYASGAEVWFTALVPTGNTFTIRETSFTDVVLEAMTSCPASSCVDYSDTPEELSWTNGTGSARDVWVVVERYYSGATGNITMEFSNSP